MKDILDFILLNTNVDEYVNTPEKYKSNSGTDLFGYPPGMQLRAMLYYQNHIDNLEFSRASDILNGLKISLEIEELALIIKKALFSHLKNVPFLKEKSNIGEMILELFSQFLDKPQVEIKQILDNSDTIYKESWTKIVSDEDNVSPEQLRLFYNSIPFPIGCYDWSVFTQNNLSIAYRALPILLAQAGNCKKVFDFGGNSGYLATAMATSIQADVSMLIEENEEMLKFAKWRDGLCGIKNVAYKKKNELDREINQYTNFFDLGICTEVLEHVYDVEETVENMARILKKEGILFISTSFGHYPEASHLKKNVRYFEYEKELMARHGLIKCTNLDFPIPLLKGMGVYIKV